MTIQDLINKSADEVNRMTAEQLTKAIAQMSRAANKRVERLQSYGYKKPVYNDEGEKIGTKWVNKKNSPGLDFNAIQNLSRPFGHVTEYNASLGRLRSEYFRVQGFLKADSSTIEGAKQLRRQKERELFGETREMQIYNINRGRKKKGEKPLTKKERQFVISNMDEFMTSVYENYHKWREEYAMEGGYTKEQGKESLANIGNLMKRGMPAGLARYHESRRLNKAYESKREKAQDPVDKSPLSLLEDDENKDELF